MECEKFLAYLPMMHLWADLLPSRYCGSWPCNRRSEEDSYPDIQFAGVAKIKKWCNSRESEEILTRNKYEDSNGNLNYFLHCFRWGTWMKKFHESLLSQRLLFDCFDCINCCEILIIMVIKIPIIIMIDVSPSSSTSLQLLLSTSNPTWTNFPHLLRKEQLVMSCTWHRLFPHLFIVEMHGD